MSAVKFERKGKISESLGIASDRFEELRQKLAEVLAKSLMNHTQDIMNGNLDATAEVNIEVLLEGMSTLPNNANEALYIGYMAGMGVEHLQHAMSKAFEED